MQKIIFMLPPLLRCGRSLYHSWLHVTSQFLRIIRISKLNVKRKYLVIVIFFNVLRPKPDSRRFLGKDTSLADKYLSVTTITDFVRMSGKESRVVGIVYSMAGAGARQI